MNSTSRGPVSADANHALLDAIHGWQPDATCIYAGDRCLARAIVAANRHWAAAGMGNVQIEARLRSIVALVAPESEPETDIQRHDAAYAVARHCAFVRMPWQHIGKLLIQLAASVPDWRPTDSNDIADLVTAVVAEARP